jgi:cell division septum initiation protein DivIVA
MENTESMMQIRQVIEALEQKITTARRVPMTGYSMVDGGAILDLIGQMRIALPKAVIQAQDVLDQEEEILANARNEADKTADRADAIYADTVGKANAIRDQIHQEADEYDKTTREAARRESEGMIADAQAHAEAIILNAQQQAQKMVDENEITRRAQAYAMETRDRAQQDADNIYNQACIHADKMLSGAAAALSRSANDLAALRDQLLSQNGAM